MVDSHLQLVEEGIPNNKHVSHRPQKNKEAVCDASSVTKGPHKHKQVATFQVLSAGFPQGLCVSLQEVAQHWPCSAVRVGTNTNTLYAAVLLTSKTKQVSAELGCTVWTQSNEIELHSFNSFQ